LFIRGLMSYLPYLCLFAYIDVQHILCCVFVFLRLVYPHKTTFINTYYTPIVLVQLFVTCPISCDIADILFCFSSSCVPYVASFSGLSIFDCPFGIL
jgi:hypothetical protein